MLTFRLHAERSRKFVKSYNWRKGFLEEQNNQRHTHKTQTLWLFWLLEMFCMMKGWFCDWIVNWSAQTHLSALSFPHSLSRLSSLSLSLSLSSLSLSLLSLSLSILSLFSSLLSLSHLSLFSVGPHIGRYCGSRQPGHVISYTGILSLSIHTDNAITKEGFSANYSIRTSSDPPQPHQG